MATNLRGVMAALLTPFDQQQALDKASLRRLVQFNIQQGIDGLYVGGSTGEAFVQSLSEREQVLEIVAEEAKGKIKLIAHVGCVSTAESQQLAASAKRYGFDAVSAVTPFYYPFSFEEHCDHYRAIIDSADGLPMVVYNIPALSGVKLTLDQINTLVTLPGVGALKQTSGDLYQMEQIRREHPDLVLYNGYDEIFASGLLAGADGGIGSTYNIMGWRYQGIFWVVVLIVSLPRWAMPTRFGMKIVGYRCVYFPSPGRGERGETTHPRSCINCWASAFSSGRYFSSTGPNGLRHSGTETTSI